MSLSGWRRTGLRERVLLWLLPALVFRALIPAGFMPTASHGLALELCSSAGYGAVFADYGPAGSPDGHGDGEVTSHEPCAFAASATGAPPPAPIPVAVADPSVVAPPASRLAVTLPSRPALRPLPRAPPYLA